MDALEDYIHPRCVSIVGLCIMNSSISHHQNELKDIVTEKRQLMLCHRTGHPLLETPGVIPRQERPLITHGPCSYEQPPDPNTSQH